jgi:hypothetical protein
MTKSRPVRVLASVAAGATAAAGGLAVIPGVPGWVAGVVALVGVVLTVAVGKYTEDNTTPAQDVAAMVSPHNEGAFVAGPASPLRDGVAVDVTANTQPQAPWAP